MVLVFGFVEVIDDKEYFIEDCESRKDEEIEE